MVTTRIGENRWKLEKTDVPLPQLQKITVILPELEKTMVTLLELEKMVLLEKADLTTEIR